MSRTPLRALALPVLLVSSLAVVACTSDAPARDAPESSTFNVSLSPVEGSGIQGLTTVSRGGEAVTLKLELMGLESGTTYTAALLSGTCDSPGEKLADMGGATSGAIGIGSSTTEVDLSTVEGAGALHIEAYLPDGSPAACGEIPAGRI